MFDYHIHTSFSFDGSVIPRDYLLSARQSGVRELAFTDHVDLDSEISGIARTDTDFKRRDEYFTSMSPVDGVIFKRGVEAGILIKNNVPERTEALIRKIEPDFVIASVHSTPGPRDPYDVSYFDGWTREEGYARYIEAVYEALKAYDYFNIAGHINYPNRGCPYKEINLRRSDAPDIIDALFRLLIERGQAIEINTGDYRRAGDELSSIDVYKRYVELGGEYVTFGSDAHKLENLAFRFDYAKAIAEAAGIRYIATFENMRPTLHRI